MLAEKYQPKTLREIVGQDEGVLEICRWLKNYSKPLLLTGPTGSGKSTIIRAIATEFKIDAVYIDNIDMLSSAFMGSFFGRKKLIVIENAESFDRINKITKIPKNYPVIITADNAWDAKIKFLKKICLHIELNRIPNAVIERNLIKICTKENINIIPASLKLIVNSANGDMRAALNDLEGSSEYNERDREKTMFEVLHEIFNGNMDFEFIKDFDTYELFKWVEHNICREFKNPRDMALAFELLARADFHRYRSDKTARSMLRFLSKIKHQGFARYEKPFFMFKNMQQIPEMRCSKRKMQMEMPFLKIIMNGENYEGAVSDS